MLYSIDEEKNNLIIKYRGSNFILFYFFDKRGSNYLKHARAL